MLVEYLLISRERPGDLSADFAIQLNFGRMQIRMPSSPAKRLLEKRAAFFGDLDDRLGLFKNIQLLIVVPHHSFDHASQLGIGCVFVSHFKKLGLHQASSVHSVVRPNASPHMPFVKLISVREVRS